MLKVRIDKAEKETFWYSNKIGQEFNVENWIGCKEWYRCTFDAKGILKSDCTVLQSDTQPEPKGYCIKRTPENAEVLNKWANKQFVSGYDYSVNEWFILSKPLCMEYKNLTSGTIPEGFKELFTVEEFFAKVGYTPEPKLIAKAGEFIKLVSTKGEHTLKVNMPVKLISNYKEGGYIQLNGYSYTAEFIEKNSMKFELCPAPVSEPVQVDTPIERDTEDFKIGQIIEVHEEPYYRKMKVESGWMYNFYDTKNDNYSRGWIFVPEHSLKN